MSLARASRPSAKLMHKGRYMCILFSVSQIFDFAISAPYNQIFMDHHRSLLSSAALAMERGASGWMILWLRHGGIARHAGSKAGQFRRI